MICDFKKRGSTFIQTAMYQECLHNLSSTRSLVISGNPGEGKTRYAVELMCSNTEHGRRLFLTYAQQLENIDLEHIDGVIIVNIYGDVSFDEDKCKRWKEQMPYLIARCKNNKPFYVIVTSRSYILMKSIDQEIKRMKNVQITTRGLAIEERVSILQANCSIVDPIPLISAFKSPIGLPQVCYMYSSSDQFCGGDIFHHPEEFINNILQTFELEDRMLFFAIALVVFHRGNFAIQDISAEEFDKINNYTRLNFGGYDLQIALTRLCGSFIQYNEPAGNYQFIHDSLFETCCSYIGGRHSDLFISLSDVRVLVEFARIQQQAESSDRIYAYIPKSRSNIINLAARYVSEMKKNARFKHMLSKSDALFCVELLSECLINLQKHDMVKQFLKVADPDESLLVEFCIMNQPELVKLVMKYMDTFSHEDWVKSQKGKAKTRCKIWEYYACLDIFQDEEEYLSEDDSYSSECSDECSFEEVDETSKADIVRAILGKDETTSKNLMDKDVLSDSEIYNVMKECIAKGICFKTTPQVTNELIHHSIRCCKPSCFKFFMERAIAKRISVQENVSMSDTFDADIKKMIETINREDTHLLVIYILVNGCLDWLLRLLEVEVPLEDIEYMHDMHYISARFGELSDNFSEILDKNSLNCKVIHLLRFERSNFITDCIYDSERRRFTPASFFIAMKSAITNRLSVQDKEIDASSVAHVERLSKLNAKEYLYPLVLYCIVNSCWDPLLSLHDTEIPCDHIEYIHDMKNVSERFKTLSDIFTDILANLQGVKVVHIVLLERQEFTTTECIHQYFRRDMPFVFSFATKKAIANRLSVKAHKNDNHFYHFGNTLLRDIMANRLPLQDNNACCDVQRIIERVDKEDVHLLALYFVVNRYWDWLLQLLEVEVPRDDIEYIHAMKGVSKRFRILSDSFLNILARSLQGVKVINIVLLERPDLTIESINQSLQCGMSFAFSSAMKNAIANRLSVQDDTVDNYFNNQASSQEASPCVQQMSKCVDKEDVHLLVLHYVVNNRCKPLLSLVDTEVPRGHIEYIHDMKNVSERFGKLSTIFSSILAETSENSKVYMSDILKYLDE